jgi:hypothetical protein
MGCRVGADTRPGAEVDGLQVRLLYATGPMGFERCNINCLRLAPTLPYSLFPPAHLVYLMKKTGISGLGGSQ